MRKDTSLPSCPVWAMSGKNGQSQAKERVRNADSHPRKVDPAVPPEQFCERKDVYTAVNIVSPHAILNLPWTIIDGEVTASRACRASAKT